MKLTSVVEVVSALLPSNTQSTSCVDRALINSAPPRELQVPLYTQLPCPFTLLSLNNEFLAENCPARDLIPVLEFSCMKRAPPDRIAVFPMKSV